MIVDIINKKRKKEELTTRELETLFQGYQEGKVKDYQMSAFLMAICCQGMSEEETLDLTDIFLNSGKKLDLSDLKMKTVDKHSTGGVGDKTTLILGPIVASCHIPMVKMSGRGLGYTGGTIDKLESIPGFKIELTEKEIKAQAKAVGLIVTSQSEELVPLDKKVYALRDVTATTESIPLIASSIMSKKIASGADKIIIDIKIGTGALIKTEEEAEELSDLMIKIGEKYGSEVKTCFSNMDHPLGRTIGNKLEVIEAMAVLQNKEKGELRDHCLNLAAELIAMAKEESLEQAKKEVEEALTSGKAYQKFEEWIKAQHGDLTKLKITSKQYAIKATTSGTLTNIDGNALAKIALQLGAGRTTKGEKIDYNAGIALAKTIGSTVKENDILALLYTNKDISQLNLQNVFEIE